MLRRKSGFTLVELMVVMGIIILVVTMAIPSIRVLTGARSISVAQNQLAAVITRAREDAIALQAPRGVLFYLDPVTGRVGAVIVQQAVVTDTTNIRFNTVLLDTLPGNDSLLLPVGVGLQTLFNGFNGTGTTNATVKQWQTAMATQAQLSASGQDDRYFGFNPVLTGGSTTYHGSAAGTLFYVGGCILFDGSGRLIVRPYGFQMTALNSAGAPTASNLCKFMGYDVDGTGKNVYSATGASPVPNGTYYIDYGPSAPHGSGSIVIMPGPLPPYWNGKFPTVPVMSQVGLVLFDHDSFQSLGFTDCDADMATGQQYASAWSVTPSPGAGSGAGDGIHTEADEENWLDSNSTPIMINRYNGTLIRGE